MNVAFWAQFIYFGINRILRDSFHSNFIAHFPTQHTTESGWHRIFDFQSFGPLRFTNLNTEIGPDPLWFD